MPQRLVLSDCARNYLRYQRIESFTPATLSSTRRQIEPFLEWLETQSHSMFAVDLEPFDILGHLEYLNVERGNAPLTLRTRHGAFHTCIGMPM